MEEAKDSAPRKQLKRQDSNESFSSDELNASLDSDEDDDIPLEMEQQQVNAMDGAVEQEKSTGFFGGLKSMLSSDKKKAPQKRMRASKAKASSKRDAKMEHARAKPAKKKKEVLKRRGRRIKEEIDTNVVAIDFKILEQDAQLAAGEPQICEECNALFSVHSKLEDKDVKMEEGKEELSDDDDQLWICEYCSHRNVVNLEKPEIPTADTINYILEPAKVKKEDSVEQSNIFCLDISGSMCVSQPINGKMKIKGDHSNELNDFKKFGDGSDQFMQGEA